MADPLSLAHERAIRQAYKVEHDLYRVETATIADIRRELEATRASTIAVLATAQKDWQIAEAQAIIGEIERQLRAWQAVAASIATGRLADVSDLGVQQVMSALKSGGGIELGLTPAIPTDFVAVAYQTLPLLITDVASDTIKGVGSILRQTVLAQQSPFEAMKQVGTLTGKGPFRTAFLRGETIVRTEYGRIAQTANYHTLSTLARDNDELKKEWSAVADIRTRASHAAADGQIVDPDADFSLGGHPAKYPHDPRLPGSESIGCRCISVPYAESWGVGAPKSAAATAAPSASTVRAARAALGPAFGLKGGQITIAGRVATPAEIERIRKGAVAAKVDARQVKAAQRQSDVIAKGIRSAPAPKPPVAKLGQPYPTKPPHPETGWAEPVGTVTLKSGLTASVRSYGDAVPGGYNGGFAAFDPKTGTRMGHLDYQSGGDQPVLIAMNEVAPAYRGKGVSDALLARLTAEFPGQQISPGMMTESGFRWWERVKAYVPHADAEATD
jgi:hypothetical protein